MAAGRQVLQKERMGVDDILPPELASMILDYHGRTVPSEEAIPETAQVSSSATFLSASSSTATMKMSEQVSSSAISATASTELTIQKHSVQYKHQRHLTLFGNMEALYAHQIAHDLVWNIKVDDALKIAEQNPQCLSMVVDIVAPNGQKLRATPFQAVLAMGDCDPRPLKEGEKHYGLVERLKLCFKDQKVCEAQRNHWFGPGSEEATKKRTDRIVNAMKTLCKTIINTTIPADVPFKELLKLRIAEEFRNAITPDPADIATSGLVYPFQVFLEFFNLWEANVMDARDTKDKSFHHLGKKWGLRSSLFAAIVYPALQNCAPRGDRNIFETGIANSLNPNEPLPRRRDYSSGVPEDLKDFGVDFFFGLYGDYYEAVRGIGESYEPRDVLKKIMSSKNMNCGNMQPQQGHPLAHCLVM